ncbi:hypothetical protein B8X04_11770 [Brevibacterium casei]|uniref:Glycosyltransferase RgtA/B/C/D-like domain-containing protein n=2 Tax=Brevibacterium casei TaxID=33889 RepID=A0A269ZB84_9MICO|nr:hypothetical protein B8X04_11770 [Brevibacterium casei]
MHLLLMSVIALILSLGTSIAFAPGGMSPDTRWQLHQVVGNEQLSDWHPAIMTIVWRWVFDLTGHTSAILYVQVLVMFAIAFGFAVYLYDVTKSRVWSMVGLAFPMLPYVFTYIGMLWKDTQMAEAFFLTAVCALLAHRFKRLRWPLLIIGLLALTYGTAVRKNAFFAVLPLVYLVSFSTFTIWSTRAAQSFRRRILDPRFAAVTAAVLALVIGSGAVLNAIYQPLKTHQVSQVMLDDVIFSVPTKELKELDIDPEFRDKLIEGQRVCRERGDYQDAYWRCYGRGENGIYTAIEHVDELRALWIDQVLTHPLRYLSYRTQTFSHFLFDNQAEWGGRVDPNSLGWKVKYEQVNDAAKTYVEGFGTRDLSWLFTGWFWTLSSLIALFARRKIRLLGDVAGWKHLSTIVVTLSLSSFIYILGYFPIVPANHFRYLYWPAMAMTMCAIMVAAAAAMAWNARKRRRVEGATEDKQA